MKILAIGRNYAEHIKELANQRPEEPVIFTKPDTALLQNNEPFYYPNFSNDIHHEVELILRICKEGKHIEEQHAHKYFDKIGLGIDFTARDLQSKAKENGLPWAIAKGFNGSAPISDWIDKDSIDNIEDLNFSLFLNDEKKQTGNTSMMLFSIPFMISYLSRYFTLKTGDIIFTGTPAGVGPVQIGDRLTGFLETQKLLDFEIK